MQKNKKILSLVIKTIILFLFISLCIFPPVLASVNNKSEKLKQRTQFYLEELTNDKEDVLENDDIIQNEIIILQNERVGPTIKLNKFRPPTIKDFSKKTYKELRQEVSYYFPELKVELSQDEIVLKGKRLLAKEQVVFFKKLKKTFRSGKSLSHLTEEETVKITKALIKLKANGIINDLFYAFEKKWLFTSKSEVAMKRRKYIFAENICNLRIFCVEFLKKKYLLEAISVF
ncbi:MAG: hypothetical protein ABIJ59_00675 [Pseudomonadota bacterium]